jgi:hypothetical protein
MIIYALMANQLVLYIGKTANLAKRRREHRCKTNRTGSAKIPSYIEWDIIELESCADADGPSRERYYYETLKPLYNERCPNRGKKEYQSMYYRKQQTPSS